MYAAHFTGDLKGDAAMDPDATRPLLARGGCATRGIVNVQNNEKRKGDLGIVGRKMSRDTDQTR